MEFSKKSKAKGMSFFAFLFSISVYISIFYIFNLSASTLINNTKFWFLISNTLILIIAADYGAFSASKQDLYDDYLMQAEATRSSSSSFVAQYMQESKQEREFVPKKEDNQLCQDKRVVHEVEPQEQTGNSDETKIKIRPRSAFRRSASLKAKRVVIDENKNKAIIRRSESDNGEVVNEFSAMSDEELNRRVEEFIERTNRQIRLQARGSLETSIEV